MSVESLHREPHLQEQKVLLNLGQGNWQTGFVNITAQLWRTEQQPVQFVGSLPPAPQLKQHHQQWQTLYQALYGSPNRWQIDDKTPEAAQGALQSTTQRAADKAAHSDDFDFESDSLSNVSQQTFEALCQTLKTEFNSWLNAASFAPIERRIRTHLSLQAAVRIMLSAHAHSVLRFPWHLWQLFEDYPNAELSLSLPNYSRSLKQQATKPPGKVKILAILGSDNDIDIAIDRQLLGDLPLADVKLLSQPTLQDLQQQLWDTHWDVLFFAGHSSSQAQNKEQSQNKKQSQGYLQVNSTEFLTIDQLKYALSRAIANGLQLAILNSCDGLGLAWSLADLHLPQAIVMREPVPDKVAHQFLKHFLSALSSGQSLYQSVREAREKLYGLTELGICAPWLPVIVQNPAEIPPTWHSLAGQTPAVGQSLHPLPNKLLGRLATQLTLRSLAITAVILGLRWLGLLQGVELWAYDSLMQLRPTASPDPRLVMVTVDEEDIQAQTSLERRGSLSDETLQKALSLLSSYEPQVIALDLYRDFPSSRSDLANILTQPNIIGTCKSLDPVADPVGIGPAPELSSTQVGFSDFIEDSDGTLRRQILTLTPDPVSPCDAAYSFSALVAIQYLQGEGLQPTFTTQGNLQLGNTVFPRLQRRSGGLQRLDNRGNQIFLNYRALASPDRIATKVALRQLLNGEVDPQRIRDRIVLIGVTSASSDYWATPYGVYGQERTSGVFLQAQMVSQIVSAVLDGRSLIWVWPQWAEGTVVLGGAIAGCLLGCRWKSTRLMLICLFTVFGLILGAWAVLIVGGWLPIVPTALALGGSALSSASILASTPTASSELSRKEVSKGKKKGDEQR